MKILRIRKKYNCSRQLRALVVTFENEEKRVFRIKRNIHEAFVAIREYLEKVNNARVCKNCGQEKAIFHKYLCNDCLSRAKTLYDGDFAQAYDSHVDPTLLAACTEPTDYLQAVKEAHKELAQERDRLFELVKSDQDYWAENWFKWNRKR